VYLKKEEKVEAVPSIPRTEPPDALTALQTYIAALNTRRSVLISLYETLRTRAVDLADGAKIPIPVVLLQSSESTFPPAQLRMPITTATSLNYESVLSDTELYWLQSESPDMELACRDLGDALADMGSWYEKLEIAQLRCRVLEDDLQMIMGAFAHLVRTYLMLRRDSRVDRTHESAAIALLRDDILHPKVDPE